MANPSLKNGYISIANELVEKLASINIPGQEVRILWTVWRKTWGWKEGDRKKDWDWISLSQFEKSTKMKHINCVKAVNSLVVKRLLLKRNNDYRFNQNHDEWVVVKRLPPVVKRLLGGSQLTTKTSSQLTTNKRNKETKQKKDTSEQSSQALFNFEEYLKRMEEYPLRHVQVIAFYFRKKKLVFKTLKEAQSAIKRHLRPAKEVSNFSDEDIVKAYRVADREYPQIYTVETLLKILTR